MNPCRILLVAALLAVYSVPSARAQTPPPAPAPSAAAATPTPTPAPPKLEQAIFAGGCFWCMQYAFDRAKGVKKTIVGYTGGSVAAPSYEDVSSGETGHAESIEVLYDPAQTTYEKLLDVFWMNIDPTTVNREFADAGTQYRTVIFYANDEQKKEAEASKAALAKSGKYDRPIVTQLVQAGKFYPAEDYHQEYYKKNPGDFQAYEVGSGRAGYIKRTWGDSQPKP
jgi:methionine-S-sulfoxide reductase